MYNQFAEEQINAFERRQREQLAAMHRMVKLIDADSPKRWAQLRSILQGTLAHMTALAWFRETSAAHKRS
ncbi:MAG: hypothetical protein ACJ8CR_17925 [Roseiflexaceae bacterium]